VVDFASPRPVYFTGKPAVRYCALRAPSDLKEGGSPWDKRPAPDPDLVLFTILLREARSEVSKKFGNPLSAADDLLNHRRLEDTGRDRQ